MLCSAFFNLTKSLTVDHFLSSRGLSKVQTAVFNMHLKIVKHSSYGWFSVSKSAILFWGSECSSQFSNIKKTMALVQIYLKFIINLQLLSISDLCALFLFFSSNFSRSRRNKWMWIHSAGFYLPTVFRIRFFSGSRSEFFFWVRIRLGQKSGSDPEKSGSVKKRPKTCVTEQ